MKKKVLMGVLALIVSIPTFAGGLLTNTNQNVAFLRMLARGASIDIDGVYSNPAGLAFLPNDGFYLSLNGQSAYQTRNIMAVSPLFPDEGHGRYYKGKASAPIIPSFQAAFKKNDWTVSASFAVVGGGGKASFDTGLPMFDSMVMAKVMAETNGQIASNMYGINSALDGKQYIYGVQLGVSYKVLDWLSVFAGGRMNYFSGGYEGFLKADMKPEAGGFPLADIQLDCDQTGWGITPILGADVKLGKWNIGLKYEFMTNLNLQNKTKTSSVKMMNPSNPTAGLIELPMDANNPLYSYKDGVNTPNDIPALLTAAVGYNFLPTLRASVEYHRFFDQAAGMADDKQKALTHGTNEYLVGVEWDAIKYLTLSGGFQKTDYGLADGFQSDTSFSCDSYSLGFGAAVKATKRLTVNVAYFWTNYSDYKKSETLVPGIAVSQIDRTYSRTNKVFGLGVDYRF
ncbi:MAG: hypothetical protein LBN24_06715 [Mediterranea sp.]|jgi:long-chain fatty acid transport protein|nr:hypothetical protein [Mediterranea sp.]